MLKVALLEGLYKSWITFKRLDYIPDLYVTANLNAYNHNLCVDLGVGLILYR